MATLRLPGRMDEARLYSVNTLEADLLVNCRLN